MKMLLRLGVVQLLLAPVLMVPSVDYWDSWGLYGECSRSCGGGVAMRTRRCITHRTDGEHNCVGQDKTYRSCNTQYCPEGSRDFREEQCSQFDGTDFQGKRYTWLPYYGADNPCELNCIPKGENFYYRHRSAVVDGTPCHPGRRDVCVAGVCKRLGCDNTLKSSQQEDPCLQCGGNGASCHRVQNSFSVRSLPTGYNQMFIIPVGATSISIRETVATRNYLAIKNLRGEYYLNGHWVIEFSRATPVAGTTLYYQRGPEGDSVPETIIGRGPTTEPLVVELISQEPNQGVEYEFYLPNGRSTEGYHWSFGSWSACSTDCGSGHQSRLVFCSTDNEPYPDSLCASQPRPQTNRTCNPHPCPLTHRMAYLYPPQLMSSSESPKACVLSWTTGEWSVCSVACGGGTQRRSVQCVSHDASGPRVVEDAVCAAYAEAPSTLQTCNSQSCYRPEAVPSIQDPRGRHDSQLFVSDRATAPRRDTDPSTGLHCSQSYYGCCPDGRSAATGPQGQGCPQAQPSCIQTSYGCCQDGATAAQGPNKEGCVEYVAPALTVASLPAENAPQCRTTTYGCCYDRTTPAGGPDGDGCPNPPNHMARSICSLPRAAGSCSSWVSRYHYDVIASKCVHFWYGGCHGNSNNFMSQAECQRACQASAPSQQGPQQSPQPGPSAHGRQAMSAARQAQSGRLYLRARRPSSVTAASLTLKGVSIDKSDPPTVEALVGQTVVLPCRVSPRPSSTVVVEWRRDGVPLSTRRHHQQPNGSLLVGPVSKSDSGWFLCVATRDRERDHRYVYLSVSEGSSQPIPSLLPKDGPSLRFSIDRSSSSLLEMRAGQTATLPCTVVPPSALQSVRIQWTKDGRPLTDSRFTQKSDGTLIVGPLKSGDSGVYTCTASSQQQLDQRQLQLRVQADLKITTAPDDVRVSEGSTALLPCVVSADDVNIGWSRNGVPIRPDGRDILQSSDGSLILNNVKPSDAGTYTCNAYTGIYSVSATADVKVIKDAQQEPDVPPECVDQPDLANCELIVYARLCSNSYYSSFCCASCTRQRNARFARLG